MLDHPISKYLHWSVSQNALSEYLKAPYLCRSAGFVLVEKIPSKDDKVHPLLQTDVEQLSKCPDKMSKSVLAAGTIIQIWNMSTLIPEAVFSPLLVLLAIAEVDVRGDKDAEEGGGVHHLTLCLCHPALG